ncbi:D-alanyl-D-alanine carboxypeptidase [Streptomyces coerulescens]|uniref:serine-type D-Ala-D-Ala carboxypeptidase n=1 Tax=Streptomyces coerulescens TaxID=29304 RepID=A0ABW0CXT0_STRCD
MEEASVAGESPDRSKQRESSAEPTSGSAIPVPESRPEPEGATEKRDPRLAVARETTAPKEPAASRGGVDTATRVLSRRELEAVRAELENSEGSGNSGAGDADDAAGDAAETEDAKAEAGNAAGADAGAPDADDADDAAAEADAGDAEPTEDAKGAGTDGDAGAGASDDRLKAAVAAWVASSDTDGKDTTSDADGDAVAEAADSDVEADPKAASDAESASPAAEEGSSETSEDPEASETPETSEAPEGADKGSAAPSDGSPEDTDTEEPSGTAEAATTADSTDSADKAAKDAAPEDPRKGSASTAAAEAPEDAEPAKDAKDDGDGGDGGDGGAGKVVDQPTAIFKAVRPAKPTVDQPTTMLKAPKPDALKPEAPKPDAPKPEAAQPEAPKPEAPAERTSKFVALKPDLRPEAPKPSVTPNAPDVTAAVPQIGPERTTQQPLPPKPPLDLLAELTNTPPPPDTAVRTAIRRVKIWTPLVILLAIVFAVVQSVRPLPAPTLELTAEDSYTFDGSKIDIPWPADGQAALDVDGIGTFGSSGDQKPVPIASVAKVMTAYVVLRDRPLKSGDEGPNIKIDQLAEDQSNAGQESTVTVTAGDEIRQREALESILIASANNVARLLARWDAGSEKAFVAKMNAAAEDLGMTNTTYTDPSGLNDTTVSTAVDQVKLAKAAMKFPAFREVAAMMSYDDYKGKNHSNWNQLVGKNNVVGIKTGTTTSALGNLVFAAKKEVGGETRTIVGAVVRQPAGGTDNTILSAALTGGDQLIRAAQDALESATILKKGDVVGYVDDGLGGRTPVVATKDVKAVGWSGLKVKLTFAPDEVPHTAKAGTQVGTLTVGDGSSGAVKIPVALQTELTEPGFTDKLTRIA